MLALMEHMIKGPVCKTFNTALSETEHTVYADINAVQ